MKTKRLTALLISILMILQMFAVTVAAEETATSGTCGENLTWTLVDGVLTISGNGPIKNFEYNEEKPWDESAVTSIVIEEGVTGVGDYTFANCNSLTSITLADSVKYLNYGSFNSCSSLTNITISSGIETINTNIFAELRSLESWGCEEDNEYFCVIDGVLYNKEKTEVISFPRGKTTSWTNIPETLTTIGESAFTYSRLTDTIILPETVTTIKSYAFIYSFEIPEVVFPSGLLTIGEKSFWNCFGLSTITIPASVTEIGEAAFGSSSGITEFVVDENNQYYSSQEGVLFDKNKTILYTYPSQKTDTNYSIPDSVTRIGESAFSNCRNLNSIVLSDNLTSIGFSAFSQCTSLKTIRIPNGVTSIPRETFMLCSGLESITLPVSITRIDSSAFDRCTALKTVTFEGHAPTEWGWNIFNEITDCTIQFYEHASGFTAPTWTAPDNVEYNTVMLPHEHHLPVYVEGVDSTCKNQGTKEHWACGCGILFSDAAGTQIVEKGDLTLDVDSNKHGETEIRNAIAATEEDDGYTGDTYCIDCNTKIAEGSVVTAIRGSCNENISWVLANGVLTVSGTGDMPSYYAFTNRWDRSAITSVVIEEGITSIGDGAFESSGLTTIHIPASVTSIKDRAFESCWNLTGFTVDENNQSFSVEDGVLFNKDKTELYLYPLRKSGNHYDVPDSVTSIAKSAFKYCFALASITLPENLRNIGNEAFWNCGSLPSVVIPASVTNIGSGAFASCNNLSSISVDENNQFYCSVDNVLFNKNKSALCAFLNKSISEYTIPESVTSIENFAFNGCSRLSAITLPDNLVKIGDYAFNMCSGLTSITIPDRVTTIGDLAFNSCSGLTTVTIPDSVTSLGSAFSWCTSLQSIYFEGNVPAKWGDRNTFYNTSENFTIYCHEGTTGWSIPKWQAPAPDGTIYNIIMLDEDGNPVEAPEVPDIVNSGVCGPNIVWRLDADGVLTISGTGDMWWDPLGSVKSAIKSVVIEDGVTVIGGYAFYGCENLTSVTLSDTVTVIKDSAFRACPALTEIVIPDSVETIELYAFENCPALESVTLGSGITKISDSAFRTCTSLKEIVIPDSVETIEVCAFQGCTSLESVVIGDSVTVIGDAAFLDCTALKSLTIGNKVTNIVESAFRNCTALTAVVIPDSVNEIGVYAFAGCTALETLVLGDKLTKIGECAFRDNTSLENVVIPKNVTEIGLLAFFNCTSLESVILDDCNPVVRDWAFQNCTALRYADLGNALTELGVGVFCDCKNLEALYFTGNAPTAIGNDAFWAAPSNVKWYYYEGTEGWTTPIWVGPNGHGYVTEMLSVGTDIPVESDTKIPDLESVPFVDKDAIVVDGKKDAAYKNAAALLVNNRPMQMGHSGALASASMLTNNGLIYLYVDVVDPQVVEPTPEVQANAPWTADSIEFLLHANNNVHQFRVDVADYLSYYRNQNGIVQAYGADAEKYFVAHNVVATENGYAIEFCIDAKKFGVSSGETVGIQMQLNDMNAAGGWSCYSYRATNHAFTVENYDKVTIGIDEKYIGHIEMLGSNIGDVPYIKPGSIEIDGQYSSVWDNALKVDIDQFNYGDKNALTRGQAYMYWTEGKWYLFVDVKDADVVTPDPEMQANAPWVTDSVELFFDFGHEHSDLVKQFRIDCSGYPSYYVEDGSFWAYGDAAKEYFDKYVVAKDADGYNIEMVINLNKFGLKSGDEIGLQMQINDVISSDPTNVYSCWNMHQSMGAGSWDADLYDYITLEKIEEKPIEIPKTEEKESVSVSVKDAVVQGSTVTVKDVDTDALASIFDTPTETPDEGTGDAETTPAAPANTVTIDVSNVKSEGAEEAEKVQQVTIPATVVDTIKTAAEKNEVKDAKLAVHLTTGSIILDKTTLDVINQAAASNENMTSTVSLVIDDAEDNLNETQEIALENVAEDEVVFGKLEITMEVTKTDVAAGTTESEKIHDFKGGTVQLEVPFEIPEGMKESGFTVYYLDEDGNLTAMDTQYVNGKIVWTTGHFSDYIIIYKEPVEETPKEPNKNNVGENIDNFIDGVQDYIVDQIKEVTPKQILSKLNSFVQKIQSIKEQVKAVRN